MRRLSIHDLHAIPFRWAFAAWAAAIACAAPAAAAPPAPDRGEQLEIVAESTTYDGKAHTYQVKGAVRITLPQLVVTCDRATLTASAGEDRIMKILFDGHVEARRGTDTFRADRITLLVPERRLVAEGTTHTRLQLPAGAGGPLTGP